MTSEFNPLALIGVLLDHHVDFVVIGGFAALVAGSPLPTQDVDITPELSAENLGRLSAALTDLEARIYVTGEPQGARFSHTAASLSGMAVLNLTTRLGLLDIVHRPAGGLDYEAMAPNSVVIHVDGLDIPLASLDDIITSKDAAGREKDVRALSVLRELRRRLSEPPGG